MQKSFVIKLSPVKIAIADVSDLGNEGHFLCRVNVPKEYRGKGIGSQLLKQVLKEADRCKIDLLLEIYPSGGLSYEELRQWYQRYGFEVQPSGYYKRSAK